MPCGRTRVLDKNDLPGVGAIAAQIDVAARLRVFDFDGTLTNDALAVWNAIEPEARTISAAFWAQWQRCFAHERHWAPQEPEKMIEVGCVFLRNRFLDFSGRAWVESIERSVAAAYVAGVTPMALLSMINQSDRAAIDVIIRRIAPSDDRFRLADTLMRLSALEGEITVAIFNAFKDHSAQVARDRLAADFREGIANMVENRVAGRRRFAPADRAHLVFGARDAWQDIGSGGRCGAIGGCNARGCPNLCGAHSGN